MSTIHFKIDNIPLALIKAEMKNYKLIKGLDNAGALTEDFYLDLDRVVLNLLGIEEEDEREKLYKIFDTHLEKIIDLDVRDFCEMLNDLALGLYIDLVAEKKVIERLNIMEAHLKN